MKQLNDASKGCSLWNYKSCLRINNLFHVHKYNSFCVPLIKMRLCTGNNLMNTMENGNWFLIWESIDIYDKAGVKELELIKASES